MARYMSCTEALAALAGGGSEPMCHDWERIRQVAMCQAWQRIEQGQASTFRAALDGAWQEIDAACAAHGGTKPEYGMLQAMEHREGPNAPLVQAVEAERLRLDMNQAVGQREAGLTDGSSCGVCERVLRSHCKLHGSMNPQYCAMWERYWTDPTMDPDDVLYELSKIETPQEQQDVVRDLAGTGVLSGA